MTFEEFKKHWELFSKIDSEDDILLCKTQYQKHLFHLEDQSYFEPKDENKSDNITDQYSKNVQAIFEFEKITPNQIYFLILPSFEPESLLIVDQQKDHYLLTYSVVEKNYWEVFYNNRNAKTLKRQTESEFLTNQVGDKLFQLLKTAINEAKKPRSTMIVLDGIVYSLTIKVESMLKTVFKHSPDSNCKTGKIIGLLETIISTFFLEKSNSNNRIEELLDEF